MEKVKLLIAILLITSSIAYGQVVPSSCLAPDSVVTKYKTDAYRITLRRLLRNNSTYKDTISIPEKITDTILNALISIYNATSLAARDTIIKIHTVHSFPRPDLNRISIRADSNLVWMQNIRKGISPTGNNTIDSLLNKYNLKLQYYFALKFSPSHILTLISDSNYNILGLTKIFNGVSGVDYSELNSFAGDGNDITDSIYSDHIEIIYSKGWGDCPAGCTERRFWKFNVYWNCSVEFVSSYGNRLPIVGVNEIKNSMIKIYPNPFTDYIYIDNKEFKFNFTITNLLGQEIKSGMSTTKIEDLQDLQKGIYFLHLFNDKKVWTQKIFKK
ncbi:MAG: T9SS type A sorting domain-containing protein [Bacteroidia bacterium]